MTNEQIAQCLESLRWTLKKFQEYDGYPSEAYRQGRIREVKETIAALRALKATQLSGQEAS